MSTENSYAWRRQLMWGLLLIGFGTAILLDRFGWFDVDDLWHYWPLVLVVVGINKMIDSVSHPTRSPAMKNEPAVSSVPAQVVLGILVIGVGLVFLLDNLGIWDFHDAIHFWPMLFILVGVVKMCDTRSSNRYFPGAVLILIGLIMTLNRLGLIYFSWRTMWPLLLILLGASVLYKAITGRRFISSAMKAEQATDTVVDVTAILGNFERRISTPTFRGGEVTTIMGGCVLDMRDSSIEGEAVLNVFAVFGGITIKCPADWTVVLHGTPVMGGFDEKTAAPPDNSKRLIVRGYAIMGGVEVRN